MSDATIEFYVGVLNQLIATGVASKSDTVLVVCGGPLDQEAMATAGFQNVTLTNLDDRMSEGFQDAENLTYPDRSFDLVVVHAGLHHCYSPHRALFEMYRVARKAAIAFEARDSLTMRIAKAMGLTPDFELEAVSGDGYERGGVANGPIPNFIYRWTEREVEKAVRSYDPAYVEDIRYFYGLRLPTQRFDRVGRPLIRTALKVATPIALGLSKLLPRQGNLFGFAIVKTGTLRDWIENREGELRLSREKTEQRGQVYR